MAPLCSLPLPAACCSSRLVQQSAAPAAALPALQQRHQARRRPSAAAAAEPAAAAERAAVPVTFAIAGSEITVDATPGQNLWEVAKDAGADITLGCSQGSCGVCEVEVWKYSSGSSQASVGIVRACIAGVPPGYARLEVRDVPLDDIWGVDGFDT